MNPAVGGAGLYGTRGVSAHDASRVNPALGGAGLYGTRGVSAHDASRVNPALGGAGLYGNRRGLSTDGNGEYGFLLILFGLITSRFRQDLPNLAPYPWGQCIDARF